MGGLLVMSEAERLRKVILEAVRDGKLTLQAAADRLEITYRHVRRVFRRYRDQGDPGLIHKNRGRPSNRARPGAFRDAVLARYKERYTGFGPTLAAEKLDEEGWAVDHETLRRWLIKARLWAKPAVRLRHRAWRTRRERFGELVQLDGSLHAWFGPNRPQACLMDMVDDATGTTEALMADHESTFAAMRILWAWVERYGIPHALYTDAHTIYETRREPTREEELSGELPLTAFGKACRKLGIGIITAHSPQAKGRVERKHGVFQDRFHKELALQKISSIDGANVLLDNGFVARLNRKFAVPPADPQDAHRSLPPHVDLSAIFCVEIKRTLQNDFTLRWNNRWYQVDAANRPLPKPRSRITLRTLLDGTVELWAENRRLAYRLLPDRPTPDIGQVPATRRPPKPYKPPANHPWRTPFKPDAAHAALQQQDGGHF